MGQRAKCLLPSLVGRSVVSSGTREKVDVVGGQESRVRVSGRLGRELTGATSPRRQVLASSHHLKPLPGFK